MRKLSVILVIAGVLVALYPVGERVYNRSRQQILLGELEHSLGNAAVELKAVPVKSMEIVAEQEEDNPIYFSSAIGILVIERIDLKIPVLRGLSTGNLKVGAGLLDGSAEIGEEGNTVLAAHRTHTYGHLFNRLNELEAGDGVSIITLDGVYQYDVYSNLVVDSDDVSVLSGEEGERVLTLITCHPLYRTNPPYRIVVKAKIAGS